jgi:hypothetical protein
MVSVSKHYYAAKDGVLKYQKKAFEISLSSLATAPRNHMVTQVLRDHTSGLFYAEVHFGPTLPNVYSFLRNAWQEKSDYPLHGLPTLISIPASVDKCFPGLVESVEALEIGLVPVSSGFQGGIKDFSTIESWLSTSIDGPASEANAAVRTTMQYNSRYKARTGVETKAELWQKGLPALRRLPANWHQ